MYRLLTDELIEEIAADVEHHGEMRVCTICGEEKSLTQDFHRKGGGYQRRCKTCRRAQIQKRRARVRQIIDDLKSGPCVDCGQSYPPYVMCFDHVRGTKKFPISSFVQEAERSLDALYAEVAKCDLRCANCHLIRHNGRPCDGIAA